MSYAGKNANSVGKTSGGLRGCALGANRGHVWANCATVPPTPRLYDIIYEGPLRREEFWGEKEKNLESKEINDFLKQENHT